ncbi:aerobic respiration two-component sensor histidine kinase ArcB [Testudinibacter sp. TR-2022]|uniref:aerobic respiration two-component sensor histidine kinase ArcB n=1 Tax=Testudinibacter sp. TR-2022 TaxID=2585029 RepID=UPI00111B8599|nr:aerobic respiration two-component sensor histidine kinase ArcB [Testudinibacter sp. TR-2022]TNH03321.1 aerobic respiration two-component sensor histidine kinase ArcB [Pasteurellaceae bacterium Phil31]TNH08195.1 aerobic respiration two-component sensor histidine kinase ArcB [Testudinibacter sp. TR-2022]TNH11380.1 aerobic respiration two-component sensor histidine kinase ArcB [Testudinibacter sp. TR-2022]TNH12678.1 aerobic respiration two-component sensor histidine kinase ArcB [Testudinibacter
MKNVKTYLQNYIDWIIRIGKIRFSLLGLLILGIYALIIQAGSTLLFTGDLKWSDIWRSVIFGLCSAPFVIYFFSVVIEKLELARQGSEKTLAQLKTLRMQDYQLNQEMNKKNLLLSREIDERAKAEQELTSALLHLEQEVRERRRIQLELEQSAHLLRSFFDASPDLVFYRGEDHRFLGANKAMEKLTGKKSEELKLLTPFDVYTEYSAKKAIESDIQVSKEKKGLSYEQWLYYPDGQAACFEILKVPYYDKVSKQNIIIGFGRDITERTSYQEMIEKSSRDKTNMMTTISHELKTPLNGIIGLSRILLDGNLDEQQRNYLQTIKVSAVSLGHIFNDLVDLEKIETHRIELFNKACDFNNLLNDINNIASVMAAQKNLKFEMLLKNRLPDWIQVDPIRLNQVLWNLISNAVKFTPKGWVRLTVAKSGQDRLVFQISDSGIGIPQAELNNIFTMYYQVKSKDNMRALGSGIGLSVSKKIASLMHGNLSVESEENIGTTFTLDIAAPEIEKAVDISMAPSIGALNILLVEDIEVNIIVAKSILEKLGYHVDIAMTGSEALKKFYQNQYDLLLLDIQLPDMSGFDIAMTLRQQYENDEIDYLPPLVALTANVLNNKRHYLQQGMDDVLSKPLSLEALNLTLKQLFGEEQSLESVGIEEDIEEALPVEVKVQQQSAVMAFDYPMLEELIELMGKENMMKSAVLFEQLMPGYIEELTQHYQAYQQDRTLKTAVAEDAHKIKGAAASLGLNRIRDIAELAQHQDSPQWEEQIAVWIEVIQEEWRSSVTALKKWIANR